MALGWLCPVPAKQAAVEAEMRGEWSRVDTSGRSRPRSPRKNPCAPVNTGDAQTGRTAVVPPHLPPAPFPPSSWGISACQCAWGSGDFWAITRRSRQRPRS